MEDSVEAKFSESAATTPAARRVRLSDGRRPMPAPPRTGIARCGAAAGWRRSDRGQYLAERTDDRFLRTAFATAQSCHSNFYNDWMDQEDLETYLTDIRHLVHLLLDAQAR